MRICKIDFFQSGLDDIVSKSDNEGVSEVNINSGLSKNRNEVHSGWGLRLVCLESTIELSHRFMECPKIPNSHGLSGYKKNYL
jgi:hypothetical protein